jgi:hypothetical protein
MKHFLANVDADDPGDDMLVRGFMLFQLITPMNTTDASASSIAGSEGARSFSTSIQSPA